MQRSSLASAVPAVGDKVIVLGRKVGFVRYIGTPPGCREVLAGVELQKPKGDSDGTYQGIRLFTCAPNCGVFVKATAVEPYSDEVMAASKIVGAAKVKLATTQASAARDWHVLNALENSDEHMQLNLRKRLAGSAMFGGEGGAATPKLVPDIGSVKTESIVVEPTYNGPVISWPLTEDQVFRAVLAFRDGKVMHFKYVMEILERFKEQSGKLPTVQTTGVPEGTRLTICGDTHGQLEDLFSIFTINGPPSPTNRYIFNGDFVDRGYLGVEICMTLFMFALLYPEHMLLNRGNHEERSQNELSGFLSEVLRKYNATTPPGEDPRGPLLFEAFQQTFFQLPLATLLEKDGRKVFIVHGGLFERPGVKITHIAAIKRKRAVPIGGRSFEDKLFEGLMWSDPRVNKGTVASDRGAGVLFGPDITEHFCAVNGLSLIIRSHECVHEGFQFHHNNRLMTVFSASRYCGRGTNKGAFIIFESDLTHTVQQYIAGSLDSTSPVGGAVTPLAVEPLSSEKEHQALLTMIIERLCLKKADLFWYFANVDELKNGQVTKLQWADGMRLVLELDLPWMAYCDDLADTEPNGCINYSKFLERYRIEMANIDESWKEAVIERICERLFQVANNIEAFYKQFDVNDDGKIEYLEFVSALESLNLGLTRSQIYELMGSIDMDKDGCIDFEEFANRFKVVFTRVRDSAVEHIALNALKAHTARATRGESPTAAVARSLAEEEMKVDEATLDIIKRVGHALFSTGVDPALVFADIDINGDGSLSYDEFRACLGKLSLDPPLTEDDVTKLLGAIDSNASGSINYVEFLDGFRIADVGGAFGLRRNMSSLDAVPSEVTADSTVTPATNWQQAIIQKVIHTLFQYRIELKTAFELFDTDGSGTVSREEFRSGLRSLIGTSLSDITDMQADQIMDSLDRDGNGSLDYVEFLSAFKVVDLKKGSSSSAVTMLSGSPPLSSGHTSPSSLL